MAVLLQREFERDGIHLEEEKRLQVQRLSDHVVQLESLFMENLTHRGTAAGNGTMKRTIRN